MLLVHYKPHYNLHCTMPDNSRRPYVLLLCYLFRLFTSWHLMLSLLGSPLPIVCHLLDPDWTWKNSPVSPFKFYRVTKSKIWRIFNPGHLSVTLVWKWSDLSEIWNKPVKHQWFPLISLAYLVQFSSPDHTKPAGRKCTPKIGPDSDFPAKLTKLYNWKITKKITIKF